MYTKQSHISHLGHVPVDLIAGVVDKVRHEFSDKWVKRNLHMMADSYVLKAVTPSKLDILSNIDSELLSKILSPIIDVVPLLANEKIVYIDISNLPAGRYVGTHIDHAIMHFLSRRIHIPLITNSQCRMAFLNGNGQAIIEKLELGEIYELNNQMPHAVYNGGTYDRWHIIMDIIDIDIYDLVCTRLVEPAVSPVVNYIIAKTIKDLMKNALMPDIG